MSRYEPKAIEAKWQERWERQRAAEVDLRHAQAKEYLLVAFPAPADPPDVHPGRSDVVGDALWRFHRMNGRRVFSPMVRGRKEQLKRWGVLHDWTKEVDLRAPELRSWSQWLFLRMQDKGLAYEEGGHWFFRLTAYADRLLAGLGSLAGWPEGVKAGQRHWLTTHRRDWRISGHEDGGTPVPGAAGATMAASVEASWYFLRHLSPRDASHLVDPEVARRWLPVDRYVCTAAGHTRHLLHARFICHVLHDLGLVPAAEPFASILVTAPVQRSTGTEETTAKAGADTDRVSTLFLGPPGRTVEWSPGVAAGVHRFLHRVWRMGDRLHAAPPTAPADGALERARHAAIERVTRSLERCRFNTAVAAGMELASRLSRALEEQTASRLRCDETFDTLLQLLHPLAPHVTEELWERRDHVETLLDTTWPEYDEGARRGARVQLVVQVDGRRRDRVEVDAGATEKEARAAAFAGSRLKKHLAGREVATAVLVPGRLLNLVTRRSA